ncbi:hypothetical protein SLEP1_g8516 [Rubroshorea leprosula]|uniref:Uncharacterized protein n=1 Tax=Rubroshorea leprosula TaxID=152421 RepID=A0AAV5IA90_9ROSI|nr:hypothetical protein SLEP1_g8516 [Rubroshorea leprosula]
MLEPPYAPSSDDPSGSDDPWLYLVDLERCSLIFQIWSLPDWLSTATSWRSHTILSGVDRRVSHGWIGQP